MKSILAFLFLICINLYGQNTASVKLEWVKNYPEIDSLNNFLFVDSTNSYLSGNSENTAVDKNGNLYLLVNIHSADYPNYTFKLIKYNPSGIFLWQIRSKDIESQNYVADVLQIDNAGGIYVAAHFFENNQPGGLYISKFNSDGTSLWTDKYNGSLVNSISSPLEIKFDNNENVIFIGYAGRIENNSVKNDSLLIIKYNQLGMREWTAETNNDSIIYRMHCQIDNLNNIIVSGESKTIANRVRIAKYNEEGKNIWSSYYFDNNYYYVTMDLTEDKNGNNYVTANSSTLNFNSKWVTIMFDKNGQWKWSKYIDRDSSSGVYESPWLINIDNNNYINVLGYENKNNISTFFLVKYDTNGTKISDRSYIDTTTEYVQRVLLDNSGNLFTAGFSQNPDKIYLIKFDNNNNKSWSSGFLTGGIKNVNNSMNLIIDDAGYVYLTTEDSSKKGDIHEVITSKFNSSGQEMWTIRSNDYLGHQVTSMFTDYYGYTYLTGWLENGRSNNLDFFTVQYDSSGKINWMNRYDGPAHSIDIPKAITEDNDGNIYVTGESKGNSNFDYVTIKYNSYGEEAWTPPPRYDGGGIDIPQGIAVDPDGYVYVSGSSIGSDSDYDFATIKYNEFGQFQWVKRYNDLNNGRDSVVSIAIDNSGNIYVAGTSDSTISFPNFLIIKYDPSGKVLWTRRYHQEGNNWEKAAKMIIDKNNNIYITGTCFTNDTKEDIITVKYKSNGAFQWMSRWDDPGSLSDAVSDIKVDKEGDVYVAGYGAGGGTGNDFVTIKYDSSGNQKWAVTYDSPQSSDDFTTGLALDYQKNCYVAGYSLNNNNYEYSLVKYDTIGLKLWDETYKYTGSSNNIPVKINVDNNGNILIGGYSGNSEWSVFNLSKYSQPGFIPTGILESLNKVNEYKLYQNFPNPFNPVTSIRYSIPKNSFVSIKLYDILGREIRILISKEEKAGSHEIKLDGSNLSSGVYFYRMSAGNFTESKKLIILK